jgi:hypothetical protein
MMRVKGVVIHDEEPEKTIPQRPGDNFNKMTHPPSPLTASFHIKAGQDFNKGKWLTKEL